MWLSEEGIAFATRRANKYTDKQVNSSINLADYGIDMFSLAMQGGGHLLIENNDMATKFLDDITNKRPHYIDIPVGDGSIIYRCAATVLGVAEGKLAASLMLYNTTMGGMVCVYFSVSVVTVGGGLLDLEVYCVVEVKAVPGT